MEWRGIWISVYSFLFVGIWPGGGVYFTCFFWFFFVFVFWVFSIWVCLLYIYISPFVLSHSHIPKISPYWCFLCLLVIHYSACSLFIFACFLPKCKIYSGSYSNSFFPSMGRHSMDIQNETQLYAQHFFFSHEHLLSRQP